MSRVKIKPIYDYIPLKKVSLLKRFALLAFIPITILVLALGGLASYFMIKSMIAGESELTQVQARLLAEKFLTSEDFTLEYQSIGEDDISISLPVPNHRLEEALQPILDSSVEYRRIKAYDNSGTIIWSDMQDLIGLNFYDSNYELRQALSGKVTPAFGVLAKSEHLHETGFGKGLEIYVPIRKNNIIVGVIEVYRIPNVLLKNINLSLWVIWCVSIFGGLFIYLSLYWLVKSSFKHQMLLEGRIYESKNRLESLIDGIEDGIALVDNNCNILTMNKSLAKRFNIPITEAPGKSFGTCILCGISEKVKEMCKTFKEVNSATSCEIELHDEKNDKTSYINLAAFPLSQKVDATEGDTSKYLSVIVLRDITKEKELTKELIRSEKLATIGTLFPKISHEIRGPLNALDLGLVSLRDKYPEEELFDLLLSSKDNLLRISNDLLAFSRVTKDQFAMLNLNDILKSSLKFLKEATGQIKYHTVNEELTNTSLIRGIPGQLEQMFVNLILNASQSMESMLISDQVLTVGTFEKGDKVIAFVKDKGVGIKKEHFNKVFEQFFTTKEEGKGTGLGMAIVHEITTNHNANIYFESELGEGTTFYVHFNKADIL